MVEFVGEEVEGAGLRLGGAVGEGQGTVVCFVAPEEGDVLEVAVGVGYVFACFDGAVEAGDGDQVAF